MKWLIFLFFWTVVIGSCRERQEVIQTLPDYVIKVTQEQICEENLPLPVLFDSVEIVFPDRSDSVVLGNIMGVQYTGKEYYVFDNFHQLFQFNSQGKVVRNFTKVGRGPYEYIYLNDIYYDHLKQQLILLVAPDYRLVFIDRSGTYIREVKLPFRNNGYECITSVGDSILVLGYCFYGDHKTWGTISYFCQDTLTPYQVINLRDFDGIFPSKDWAIGRMKDDKLAIGYTTTYDTLCIVSSHGTVSKQALNLLLENPHTALDYRYYGDELMMIWACVDKGEHNYGYCLLHDQLSGKSKMWNSWDFSLIGSYLCTDRENIYFIYNPANSYKDDYDVLQKFGYGTVLQKLDALNLTVEDNPVILRYHLRTPEELRKVLEE